MAIITISRGTFSGGMMLAEELSQKLNYRCVGREEIVEMSSKKYGVVEEKLRNAILKRPSGLKRFTYERERYLAFFQAVLCEYAGGDNIIYHGNAGHFLLKGVPHVLRVRIVAPMQLRVKFVMERQQVLHDEAVKYIEKIDKERFKWTKFLYRVDWRSPELYDIVFNLETENIHFISNMIQYAVQREPFKTTPESQRIMDDLALSSLVRAAIASDSATQNIDVIVKAKDGAVTVFGKALTQQVIDRIGEIARSTAGVKEVKNEVGLNYRYQNVET
ncbi:MAG: BON domain-containing protein [Candidatus Abyssobacteria bacterium SURF_5]|uniref:BON domain-containing protein n=1 Tax=Abyssobacteria bacterium (strain SURF_5) TaxID=2093360 RepID=A0A3A4P2Q7_ABYX5|nr:MAG: BON domain-containing protein [Candidatus Abyssubacteria bacterium SURF_5]